MPDASPQAVSQEQGLWARAPAWRSLVVTATLLTAAAVALPFILPSAPKAVAPAPKPLVESTGPEPKPVVEAASPAPQPVVEPAGPAPAGSAGTRSPQACLIAMPPAPTSFGAGMVVSVEDRSVSLARIKKTEAQWGGLIEPDYVDNLRVNVRLPNGQYSVFLVPKSLQVHPGDRVRVQNAYRNVNLPCDYVPPLIIADFGQAPEAAEPAPAPFTGPGAASGASAPPER